MTRAGRGDRGSATVWVLIAGALVVLTAVAAAGGLGSAIVVRHRAEAAADLGALAGAGHVLEGPATACRWADRIVRANAARLAGCEVDGLDVTVTAGVALPTLLPLPGLPAGIGPSHAVRAEARAGPVIDARVPVPYGSAVP